ncbi:MAG: fibronectin type III domain-containing protein, partial [Clostridiaceae bacterium]
MKSKKKIRFLLSVFISLIMIFSVVQPAMVEADPIIPAAPKDFKADAGITKIALNWGAAAKAAEYDLEVDGKIISTETNTSYVHENLLPGSIHTYRVRTKGESWTSEWSAALKVKTQLITPNEPKNFKITSVSNSSIAMEWKDTLLAASYEIEVDGKVVSNILSTSYQQNNLAPSSKHTFRVRAQNDAGVSNWSECYEVTTFPDAPLSPKNLKASNLNDGNITITWDKVNGAEYYDVFADNKLIENLSKNTFSQNFTLNDKVHIYAVRAKNSGGVSEWSQEISIKYSAPKPYLNIKSMIPSVPTNVRTNSALDSIKVTWNLVKNAESYDIEADGHIITGITRNEYTLSGISQGTVHTFRVRAKNKNGISGWSSLANNKTTLKSPAIPTNFNANAVSYDCIVIAWDMVNGATDYELEVDGKIIEISINIKYIHTQLTENSNHKYRIRSKNAAGYSKWSETISTTTLSDTTKTKEIPTNNIPDNPVITVNNVEQTPDNPVTNRNKVEQTSENQVTTEINVQQASDNPITTGNNLAQTSDNPVKTENDIPKAPDIPLTSVKNEIEVTQDLSQTRTVKSIAVSRIYSSETDIQAPTAPSNLSVTSTTAASIGLSWTASTDDVGVTEYDIYSGTQLIGTTTGEITCTATCLTPGTNYSFTVKAKDAANNISPESNLLSVSTVSSLTVPVNINTTAANNSVNISWDSATGATGYDIEVDGVIIDNGINTTYNHSGLTTNSQHTYRVRAKDNTNTTEWSSLITVTTLLDTPVNVNGASTDNSIGLIWSQVTGATGYDVEADGTIVDNGSSTSFTHSELVQGSQHTYRVRAKNSSVNSDWSNLLTMTAVLATSTISSNTVLNENVIYGALTISGGTFDLNGHNVTIVGNLNQSGGTFNGNSGLLNVSVNYSQNGGTLNVNSGRINISGNYSLSNSALLMMTNSGDYIYVGGNFAASQYTNETNKLTSGILEVKGNFTQNNLFSYNFTASGDNVVVLSGNNIQTVYFRYPDYSCFNMLDTSKSAGVIFSTPIKLLKLGGITNLDKAGSLTLVSSSIIMDEDYTLNLNLTIGSGMQVDLNGFTLNVINGLIQKDGTINVSGGSLNVTNGFIMSGGTLIVNSGEVNITGSLTQSGGTLNGNSGLLNISENYSQNGGTLNVNSGRINISGNYSLSNSALLMM